ncbi:MAG: nuclear transport factor 2 family protein [Novosphingobium sp.]|nr:nuclear transport factor 2 family protein [Novosphingobium sp.]
MPDGASGPDGVTGIAGQPDALAAKQAITELVYRYAQVVRYDRLDETADLYVADGLFEVRRGACDRDEHVVQSREVGRDAIRAMLRQGGKGNPHPVPLIHNLLIEVDGDTASATCVMEGRMSSGEVGFWGEYRDSFARVDGRWFFSARVFTIFEAGSSI